MSRILYVVVAVAAAAAAAAAVVVVVVVVVVVGRRRISRGLARANARHRFHRTADIKSAEKR